LGDPSILFSCTQWTDITSLWKFTYDGPHLEFYRRRRTWFVDPPKPPACMWWMRESAEKPTPNEAVAKLAYLWTFGSSPRAFTFKRAYDKFGEPIEMKEYR